MKARRNLMYFVAMVAILLSVCGCTNLKSIPTKEKTAEKRANKAINYVERVDLAFPNLLSTEQSGTYIVKESKADTSKLSDNVVDWAAVEDFKSTEDSLSRQIIKLSAEISRLLYLRKDYDKTYYELETESDLVLADNETLIAKNDELNKLLALAQAAKTQLIDGIVKTVIQPIDTTVLDQTIAISADGDTLKFTNTIRVVLAENGDFDISVRKGDVTVQGVKTFTHEKESFFSKLKRFFGLVLLILVLGVVIIVVSNKSILRAIKRWFIRVKNWFVDTKEDLESKIIDKIDGDTDK